MDDDDEIERILREELGDELPGVEEHIDDGSLDPRFDDDWGDL